MITQKRFLIAKLDERGLMLLYMGQTTNGELGLTANENVLVFQVLASNASCPALYFHAPIGGGFEAVPKTAFAVE